MSYDHITVSREGRYLTVTMNRPERRNALSLAHMTELIDAFAKASKTDAAGIVLAANGTVFSAGHDFADMAGASLHDMRTLLKTCTELMTLIQSVPQVVIAQVQGLATAAGCHLVGTCDLAVAADTAGFSLPGGKAGWFCHTPLVALARNLGRKRALEMALTGDVISAASAAESGLVNRVVPVADLAHETLALLRRATRGSALSKGLGKQCFYDQVDLDQPKAYAHAVEVMASASQTPEGRESVNSFLEKRPAHYRLERRGEQPSHRFRCRPRRAPARGRSASSPRRSAPRRSWPAP